MPFENRLMHTFVADVSALGSLPAMLFYCLLFKFLGHDLFAVQLLAFVLLAYVVILPIRYFWPKERPVRLSKRNIFERLDAASFPSMHAMRAAGLATLVWIEFPEIPIRTLFIVLGVVLLATRLILKKHHRADLVVGAAFGIILATVIGLA